MCRVFVEKLFRNNPDESREKIELVMKKFTNLYGFSKEKIKDLDSLVEKVFKVRDDIKELRAWFIGNKTYSFLRIYLGINVYRNSDIWEKLKLKK